MSEPTVLHEAARFPISFDARYRRLSTALGILPKSSYVDIDDREVRVRMGWAFRARFPLAAVASVAEYGGHPISRGVHGWRGRWLVNGAGTGIVTVDLDPPQPGYMMGFPLKLRQLMVSFDDPAAAMAALTRPAPRAPGA